MLSSPQQLITRRTGDWWKDDRRNWCAYCGIRIAKEPKSEERKLTKDHVVSRLHKGRHITVPSCLECNQAKKNMPLPDFLVTDYFVKIRERRSDKQWPLQHLWLAMALASVEQARSLSTNWPLD